MSGIAKGNGKVHAHTTGTITVCNRDLGPGSFLTTAEVTCKVCGPVKAPQPVAEPAPVVKVTLSPARTAELLTDAIVVIRATRTVPGRRRHGLIKRARDIRKAQRKAILASL